MLIEGVKLSDGTVIPVTLDDDGKVIISGDITIGDITLDNVEISNDDGNPIPVTGALTDTQLRATAVPVSGPLTDDQLRASAIPVSASALPLPTGAATSAQIGEVQASPTANTVLDRLKSLATLLSGGLPAALTAGGGVKTGLVDAIPAGTNLIGRVGSDTSGTAAFSNVAASASNVTILTTNANRKRVVIVNDSTATLYLKFGATASATSYTYILYGGDTYESSSNPIYTGQIDGIWASATGAARVTEMT